jgi:DNA-binding MarR family transcriptional regulator
MPKNPQKSIDVILDLPQDLKDIGFQELCIKDENGIIKLEDDSLIWFPFYVKNYGKSITKIEESLLARKMDERVVKVACIKITDVLIKCDFYNIHGDNGNNPDQETQSLIDEISVLIEKYKDITYVIWEEERAKRYQVLRQTVRDNIPESWEPMEFVLTCKGILHIKNITLPLIGIILGNPSTYKTVGIGFLRRWFNAYYADKINPKSFVSHANVENKEDLEYVDLIREMKDRLFLIPELSPIFMQKEEILIEILSTLVRLADGEGLLTHSGLHGLRGIDGKLMFSMVGASIEIPSRVYKVLSSLGPKLYFYRTNFREPTENQLQDEITGKDYELKAKAIKDKFFDYLKWLEICPLMVSVVSVSNNQSGLADSTTTEGRQQQVPTRRMIEWDKTRDDMRSVKLISKVAIFLSRIRGNTYAYETKSGAKLSNELDDNNNGSSFTEVSYEYSYEQPIIENPSRANIVLYNIARAHAFEIHGRNYITKEDVPMIIKIALSTANRNRVSVLKLLLTAMRRADNSGEYEHKRQFFTRDLIEALNISKSTARRVMKELEVLGLVRIGKEVKNGGYNYYIELLEKFDWLLQKEFQELMQGEWQQVVIDKEEVDDNHISESIYRAYPSSDLWECKNCKLRADIHFMENHDCSGCGKEDKDKDRETRRQIDKEQITL